MADARRIQTLIPKALNRVFEIVNRRNAVTMVKARRSGRRFFQVRCGALFSSFLARPRRLQSWAAITRALPPGRCWARNPSATYVLTTSARAVSSAPQAERPTVRGQGDVYAPALARSLCEQPSGLAQVSVL